MLKKTKLSTDLAMILANTIVVAILVAGLLGVFWLIKLMFNLVF